MSVVMTDAYRRLMISILDQRIHELELLCEQDEHGLCDELAMAREIHEKLSSELEAPDA